MQGKQILGHSCSLLAISVVLAIGLTAVRSNAQPIEIYHERDVYIKMDFWKPRSEQSAEAWFFDPANGGLLTQLPNDPSTPTAPPRAKFTVERFFPEPEFDENHAWFIGVPEINVGIPGSNEASFNDLSHLPQYSEMIDLAAMYIESESGAGDPCGERIWPIATGSEMTRYWIGPHVNNEPPLGRSYGMRMERTAHVGSAVWRWKNPAGLAQQDIYLRLKLRFDWRGDTYPRWPVRCSWISAGGGCEYNICLEQGQGEVELTGPSYSLEWQGYQPRIIAAVPHTLDHTTEVRLWRHMNGPPQQKISLLQYAPINSVNHLAAHKCEPDGQTLGWHTHGPSQTGHLQFRGLEQAWQGEFILTYGDMLFTTAKFNVPLHGTPAPVGCRALYMVFWHVEGPLE